MLRVTEDVEDRFKLNTAVSALIELEHAIADAEGELAQGPSRPVFREALETLVLLLSPFAPHVCEEIWMRLGRRFPVVDRNWPVADAALARDEDMELAVQVNGKVRGRIRIPRATDEAEIRRRALEEPHVREHLAGRELVKVVVVPERLVSLVVR
jgi:leucyl-tRNA synthetase